MRLKRAKVVTSESIKQDKKTIARQECACQNTDCACEAMTDCACEAYQD